MRGGRTFFEGGQTARPKGLSVVELAFQVLASHSPRNLRDSRMLAADL